MSLFSAIWAFFYLVASSCIASIRWYYSPTAATVFGFLTCPLYIALVSLISTKTPGQLLLWPFRHIFPGRPGGRDRTQWIIFMPVQIYLVKCHMMGQSSCSDADVSGVRQASGPAWDMRTDPEWVNRVNRLSGSQSNTSRFQLDKVKPWLYIESNKHKNEMSLK